MQREIITRRTLVYRCATWAAAAGVAGAQSRPQSPSGIENPARLEIARQADERVRSLDSFVVPKETEPAFVFQP